MQQISLAPVDGVHITTLMDNSSDALLPDEGLVRRWGLVGTATPLAVMPASPLLQPLDGAQANKPDYVRELTPGVTYGDFNGDGLEDELSYQHDASGQALLAWVRWNTGRGYGPRVAVPDFFANSVGATGQVRLMDGDFNGDGRDDLLILSETGDVGSAGSLVMALSRGDGSFATTPVAGGPGLFDATETYATTRAGDFNGDGFPDLVRFKDVTHLEVLTQTPHYDDRIVAVADEPTPWDAQTVVYDSRWSDKPEPVAACVYPLACTTHGLPVVRQVLSREHLVNPSAGELTDASAHSTYYSYEDPVSNLRGRGFLGFRKVRQWDPWRPIETVSEYDNRTQVGPGYYPGVASPIRVTTVVPYATPGGETPPDTSGPNAPTTMLAHVTRTETTSTVYAHHKAQANDPWGLTYSVSPTASISTEWTQAVSIDTGIVDAANNPGSEHLYNPDPAQPLYGPQIAGTILRSAHSTASYDDEGNVTAASSQTDGGQGVQVVNRYKNQSSPIWRRGELTHQEITRSEAGHVPADVTRTADFVYDDQGRLTEADREKGAADASLSATTHLAYDAAGNVVTVQVTAVNDQNVPETRETRMEYAPAVPGWPDERLYPSQVWSPNAQAAYRPSAWIAVHPGYGVPIATMDANGVQSQTQYDNLGRIVGTVSDGGPAGSVTYAERPDSGGGNGLIVTALVGGQMAQQETDALGRTLQSGDRAFDGTQRTTQQKYDLLGRLKAISRPYPAGTSPNQFTTFAYDALDRTLSVTAPDATVTHTAYPSFFETHNVDASGNESVALRDVDDRLVESRNLANGQAITTAYAYGPLGVDHVTDAKGNVTHTEYNRLGLAIAQDDPDTGRTTLAYTGFGQPWQRRHVKSGDLTTLHYDAQGRLIHQTSVDGDTLFGYDTAPHGIGAMAEATSPDHVTSRFYYDATTSQPVGIEQAMDGYTDRVGMSYSPEGELDTLLYPSVDGSLQPGLKTHYGYTGSGYLQTVATQVPNQAFTNLWQVTSRTLEDGLLQGQLGLANPMAVQRHYEALTGRVDSLSATRNNQTLWHLGYGYHPNGLVASREDTVAQRQEHFAYDALLRLTHVDLTYAGTVHNTEHLYDTIGNLTQVATEQHLIGQPAAPFVASETNTYGSADPAFPQPHTLTKHDAGGVTDAYVYDSRGRQTQGGGRVLSFNDVDLPKTVTKGSQVWTYAYDAFGAKVKETDPDQRSTVYVGGIYERRTIPGSPTQHVFHVEGTDGAVADLLYTAGGDYVPQYLLQDTLGSTSAIVDANGNVERRHYDAFGQRANADGTPFSSPWSAIKSGYTGHEQEDALGLINMRGRIYDPKLKRFLSPDPLVSHPGFGQSWNPYSYVLNSPLNFTDPSGYEPTKNCTNMADQSVCYPNTPTGGSGSGGGSGGEHKGDLNGQAMGPNGSYKSWAPHEGQSVAGNGRSGSQVAQSNASGYRSVTQSGPGGQRGGQVDAPLRIRRSSIDDDGVSNENGKSRLSGSSLGIVLRLPEVDQPINPHVYWSHSNPTLANGGNRSLFAYVNGSLAHRKWMLARELFEPIDFVLYRTLSKVVGYKRTKHSPYMTAADKEAKFDSMLEKVFQPLKIARNRTAAWIVLGEEALNALKNGAPAVPGFNSQGAQRLLQIMQSKGSRSMEAYEQAAELALDSHYRPPRLPKEIKP